MSRSYRERSTPHSRGRKQSVKLKRRTSKRARRDAAESNASVLKLRSRNAEVPDREYLPRNQRKRSDS